MTPVSLFASAGLAALLAAGVPATAAAQKATTSTATRKADVPTSPVLNGRDFKGEGFKVPHLEAGGMQLLQHFGAVAAEVDLPRGAMEMVATLKGREDSGAWPVVSVKVERISGGKYLSLRPLENETINEGREITRTAPLPSGHYRVTLEYYKASAQARPQLEVRTVAFR